MAKGLLYYARQYVSNRKALEASLSSPLLLWEAPPVAPLTERWRITAGGLAGNRPRAGEPLVYEVKKGAAKGNPFAMGVTMGRMDNNDVVLDDESVSRFHAWLQQDAKGWTLVDADSRNGTWLAGKKLAAKEKVLVADGQKLKLGSVELNFYEPKTFLAQLKDLVDMGATVAPPGAPVPPMK
jgi:hypothetical protein